MLLLITGAGGYLGTVLVRQLLDTPESAVRLRILDRFDYGVQPLMAVVGGWARPEILAGDVRDPRVVRDALDGVDQIVHLAAVVGYPACDANPQEAEETNVEATRQLCALADGRRVLLASTGSCYGSVQGLCTEDTPLSPLTRYGRTKREAELAVATVGGVILRFATLYGPSPRMRWDLLPNAFCLTAVREVVLRVFEGHARRTFLHVEDAAALITQLLWCPCTGIYNVGTPTGNRTKGEVANLVSQETGCQLIESDGHDPDERDYHVSYDKVAQAVGLEWATHTIEQEIPSLVQWARLWR